jgi:hypothetical protein
MSSLKKTISINPNHFTYSGGNKTRKKHGNHEGKGKEIKVKNQKKEILKKLREQQQKNINTLFQPMENSTNLISSSSSPQSDFAQSVDFLSTLEKTHAINHPNHPNHQNPKNYTFKRNHTETILPLFNTNTESPYEINIDTMIEEKPEIVLHKAEQPLWGCLKNGKLQTYRTWKSQTQKQTPITFTPTILVNDHSTPTTPISNNTPSYNTSPMTSSMTPISTPPINPSQYASPLQIERIKRVSEMKQMMEKQLQQPKKKSLKRRKTIRRTFHTGKSKTKPIISVLVSNKTIRKNITTKANLLKQKPISEIRSFLIKKGLIKIGSSAPNDVLRKMYESIILTGDVTNHNPENLLYNYLGGGT